MIELSNVSLHYGKYTALAEVNLHLPQKSFAVIQGASGAGKSSLLRLIAGFEVASTGDVRVGGDAVKAFNRRERALYRRSIGYTGNDVPLLMNRSCYDNVALPLQISGFGDGEIRTRVAAALQRVGLANDPRQTPDTLSGGQQLRLQIARAIVNRPVLLLADEPTAELDDATAMQISKLFQDFHKAGVTVVVATHDPKHFRQATHFIELTHGVITTRSWDDVANKPPSAQV